MDVNDENNSVWPHALEATSPSNEFDEKREKAFRDAMTTGTGFIQVSHVPVEDVIKHDKPQEWDGWNNFNESQPIEDLKEYLVCVQRTEGDCYPFISVWHDGKWWKTSQMPMPFKVTHFKEIEMPKSETPAQAEEREREERIAEMYDAFTGYEGMTPDWNQMKTIYDWLKSTGQLKDKSDEQ